MEITGEALSKSSSNSKERALALFDILRTSSPENLARWPVPFKDLPEEVVCSRPVYHAYAGHLYEMTSEGGKNNEKNVAPGTAQNYLGQLLTVTNARFRLTGAVASKEFLQCLSPKSTSDSAAWYRKVRSSLANQIMVRAAKNGEELDHSAVPLYPAHMAAINRAYSLDGSQEVRHCLRPRAAPLPPPARGATASVGSYL